MRIRRSLAVALLAATAVGLALIVAALWLLTSDNALRWVAGELTSRSEGRLVLDGVTGSLGSAMHISHLRYSDPDLTLTADDLSIDWSPRALLSKTVIINGLSAARIEVTAKPGGGASALPASLAIAWSIDIGRADIGTIDIVSGPNRWRISQVAFRYSGGPDRHELRDLALDSPWGSLRGTLGVASSRPFAVDGNIAFNAGPQLKQAQGTLAVGGDLAMLKLTADAVAMDARAAGNASVAPFDSQWMHGADLKITGLDLARFDAALPSTALSGSVDQISVAGDRFQGRIKVDNARAGPWSDGKMPIVALSSTWTFKPGNIELGGIEATLTEGGRAAGDARFGTDVVQWNLALAGIDLHGVVTDLRPTHLAGAVTGRLDLATPELTGNASGRLEQAGISVAFDAALHDGNIDLRRFVARAHGGTLEGTATLAMKGQRAFAIQARATALDPSQFGEYPAVSLFGTVDAHGALEPHWSSAIDFKLAPESELRGRHFAGEGSLALSASRVHDAKLDLAFADDHLRLSGDFGGAGDQINFVLDAPNLAAIDARIAGRLRASGRLSGTVQRPGLVFDASGEALRFGEQYSAATLAASGEIGSGAGLEGDRQLKVKLDGTALLVDTLTLRSAHADIDGTIGHHLASVALAGGEVATPFDLNARAEGGWTGPLDGGGWSGKVLSLEGHGTYPLSLAAPAQLEARKQRIELIGARGTLAGGHFDVDELHWEHGRLASRGSFTALPAKPLLELAGARTRFASTLTLGGHWSITATPRLNGTLVVSRESGDLAPIDSPQLLLGLSQADLNADFVEDRVHATLIARSRYANIDIAADLAATAQPGGAFGEGAPLQLSAHFDATSLRELQALAGTTALIDGQIRADLTGHGTLDRVRFSGTIEGDSLKLEAPQYGVYRQGWSAARDACRRRGHAGRIVIRCPHGQFCCQWHAARCRQGRHRRSAVDMESRQACLIRPSRYQIDDLRIGHARVQGQGRRDLAGAMKADEGYFEFQPSAAAVLGDDVVVRGRGAGADRPERLAAQRVPFAVDLTLDFGDRLQLRRRGVQHRPQRQAGAANDRGSPTRRQWNHPRRARYLHHVRPGALDRARAN